MTYSSNIEVILNSLSEIVNAMQNTDIMLRTMATTSIPLIRNRVHVEGQDSSENQIGTYDDKYLLLRQGKYNRTKSSKVILSLTRQMENDLSVIADGNSYAVGYKNAFNFQKSQWMEKKYGKSIFRLSESEQKLINQIALNHVQDAAA